MTADPALDQAIEAVAQQIADGEPVAALRRLAHLLEEHPEDPAPYREAARALFAALEQPQQLAAWPADEKHACYSRLILQAECPTGPHILAAAAAARLTSANRALVATLVAEIAPALLALVEAGEPSRNLVLFLLVVRESIGDRVPQEQLSALHRQWFGRFTPDDLTLPYSVLFYPESFARNRRDLMELWERDGQGFLASLEPHQILLVEWLAARTVADDAVIDGAAARAAPHAEPALRALRLRHGPSAAADESESQITAIAHALADARAELPCSSGMPHLRRLESRNWMAVNAARNIAAARLPFLAGGQRRVRIAVCVSGQLRGFRRVLPTWRRTLFAHADCTYFVHSWEAIGRSGAQPSRAVLPFAGDAFTAAYRRLCLQEGFLPFQQRYPSLFAALREGATVTAEEIQAFYKTPYAVIDDETAEPFATFSNQQKMHHKIWAAHQLMVSSAERFDLVVRIRPDLEVRAQAFDWRDMAAACARAPLLFTERPYGVQYGNLLIGDQFAIGAPLAMARYADAWVLGPQLASLDVAGCPTQFRGHVSLAQSCWLGGLDLRRAPVRFGTLREPERLSTGVIITALEKDSAPRMDAIDRELIDAARADASRKERR